MKVQGIEKEFAPLQADSKARQQELKVLKGSGARPEEKAVQAAGRKTGGAVNLEEAVSQANKIMETYSTELHFRVHQGSGEIQVQVINSRDDSVIREIPPERVLDFVAHVKKMLGVVIDEFI